MFVLREIEKAGREEKPCMTKTAAGQSDPPSRHGDLHPAKVHEAEELTKRRQVPEGDSGRADGARATLS